MFDRTDPADLQALQTEVNTDPISMGYAAVVDKTKELLDLLNNPSNNVGGETAGAEFTHEVLMQTWEPKGTLNEHLPWIEALTREADPRPYESIYRANASPASITALDALIVPLSRAEVLFGQGTVITEADWFAARDYTP
jgi:hypothetical protein